MATELKHVLIVSLNESNYAISKVQCTMALKKDGVWSGTEVAQEDARELERYNRRKDKALSTIVLSNDPFLLYLLGDTVDPVAVWTKLEEQFQKSWVN